MNMKKHSWTDKDPTPEKKRSKNSVRRETIAKEQNAQAAGSKEHASKENELPDLSVMRTESFEPVWSKNYTPAGQSPVPVHTLLLGTHPSITSLDRQQYFGHDQNAFWWIAGDCLGFRRGSAISPSTGKAYKLAEHLRYPPEDVLSYDEQLETLTKHGFALWDIVGSCQRPGSLDQDIRNEQPNAIKEFCQEHVDTLRRIVMCNGGTGSKMFVKHFRDWLESGELIPLEDHEASQKAFGPAILRGERKRSKEQNHGTGTTETKQIVLISAVSISPSAAKFSYIEKRNFWEENIYKPGVKDFHSDD